MYDTEYLVVRITQSRGADHEEPFRLFRTEETANAFVDRLRKMSNEKRREIDPDFRYGESYYEMRPIQRGD